MDVTKLDPALRYRNEASPAHAITPAIIVPIVQAFVRARSVVDWGCNNGYWLREFGRQGAESLHGFDMQAPDHNLLLAPEDYTQVDFENEIPARACDLAINLENAEHISESRADCLVTALTDSAPTILFSAATPGQGGQNHVNEQHHSYWHYKFGAKGYMIFDAIRWCVSDNSDVPKWYRDNMFLYSRVPLPVV